MGLLDIPASKAGDTVVVAAASGAVGFGGRPDRPESENLAWSALPAVAEKCRYVVELGFDACVSTARSADFAQQLAATCQGGIDVSLRERRRRFVFDAVLPLLNVGAQVPCVRPDRTTMPPDCPARIACRC